MIGLSRIGKLLRKLYQVKPKQFILIKDYHCDNCQIEKYAILEQTDLEFHIGETSDARYNGAPSAETWIKKNDPRIVDVVLDDEDTTLFSQAAHFLDVKPFVLMNYHNCNHCHDRKYKILDVTNKAYLIKGIFDFDCVAESKPFYQQWILKDDPRIIDVSNKELLKTQDPAV